MAKYEINKLFGGYEQTVEADQYDQRGEYFVFINERNERVLTVSAALVQTIDLADESE